MTPLLAADRAEGPISGVRPGDRAADGEFTDAELTALALAADPALPLADDAVPLNRYLAERPAPLPDWYMPPVMARGGRRWRIPVVAVVVGAFLLIEILGLCSTFGQLNLS